MPSPRPRAHHSWQSAEHRGCVVCAPFLAQRRTRNVARIRRVAASLPAPGAHSREAGPDKQETPQAATREVSTAPRQGWSDGRAAGAQCDTRTR